MTRHADRPDYWALFENRPAWERTSMTADDEVQEQRARARAWPSMRPAPHSEDVEERS